MTYLSLASSDQVKSMVIYRLSEINGVAGFASHRRNKKISASEKDKFVLFYEWAGIEELAMISVLVLFSVVRTKGSEYL